MIAASTIVAPREPEQRPAAAFDRHVASCAKAQLTRFGLNDALYLNISGSVQVQVVDRQNRCRSEFAKGQVLRVGDRSCPHGRLFFADGNRFPDSNRLLCDDLGFFRLELPRQPVRSRAASASDHDLRHGPQIEQSPEPNPVLLKFFALVLENDEKTIDCIEHDKALLKQFIAARFCSSGPSPVTMFRGCDQ